MTSYDVLDHSWAQNGQDIFRMFDRDEALSFQALKVARLGILVVGNDWKCFTQLLVARMSSVSTWDVADS